MKRKIFLGFNTWSAMGEFTLHIGALALRKEVTVSAIARTRIADWLLSLQYLAKFEQAKPTLVYTNDCGHIWLSAYHDKNGIRLGASVGAVRATLYVSKSEIAKLQRAMARDDAHYYSAKRGRNNDRVQESAWRF